MTILTYIVKQNSFLQRDFIFKRSKCQKSNGRSGRVDCLSMYMLICHSFPDIDYKEDHHYFYYSKKTLPANISASSAVRINIPYETVFTDISKYHFKMSTPPKHYRLPLSEGMPGIFHTQYLIVVNPSEYQVVNAFSYFKITIINTTFQNKTQNMMEESVKV